MQNPRFHFHWEVIKAELRSQTRKRPRRDGRTETEAILLPSRRQAMYIYFVRVC